MVFGPFHYCTFCERAAPDALETIDDQRRCTGCRYRTIYGGSRGSASLPRRRARETISIRYGEPEYGAFLGHIALNCLAHWFGNNHGGPIHKAGRGTGNDLIRFRQTLGDFQLRS